MLAGRNVVPLVQAPLCSSPGPGAQAPLREERLGQRGVEELKGPQGLGSTFISCSRLAQSPELAPCI